MEDEPINEVIQSLQTIVDETMRLHALPPELYRVGDAATAKVVALLVGVVAAIEDAGARDNRALEALLHTAQVCARDRVAEGD